MNKFEKIRYLVGVDLAQSNDYSAIAIIEERHKWDRTDDGMLQDILTYHVSHLWRARGITYPEVAKRVQTVMMEPRVMAAPSALIIDATGLGRPFVDGLRKEHLLPIAVTITGAEHATQKGHHEHSVPKKHIVGSLLMMAESRLLKIASGLKGPDGEELSAAINDELLNLREKINKETGHASYEHAQSNEHDDLAMAVALACWYGLSTGIRRPLERSPFKYGPDPGDHGEELTRNYNPLKGYNPLDR